MNILKKIKSFLVFTVTCVAINCLAYTYPPIVSAGNNITITTSVNALTGQTTYNVSAPTLATTNSPTLFSPIIINAAPTVLTQSGTNLVVDGSVAGYASSMKFKVTLTNNCYIQFTNWSVGSIVSITFFQGTGLTNLVTYNTNASATVPFTDLDSSSTYKTMPTNTATSHLVDQWLFSTTTNADLGGQSAIQ